MNFFRVPLVFFWKPIPAGYRSSLTEVSFSKEVPIMYTYSSFESFGTFTLLRPILFLLLGVALILCIAQLIPKIRTHLLNGFAVISLSLVTIAVAVQVVYYHAIIVDEIGLGGDAVSLYLFIAIAFMGVMNVLLYLFTRPRKKQDSAFLQ